MLSKLYKQFQSSSKSSKEENILILEQELKKNYNIPVNIILAKKKHASGRIKHTFENYIAKDIIELRISSSLSTSYTSKVAHELCSKLVLKVKPHKSISQTHCESYQTHPNLEGMNTDEDSKHFSSISLLPHSRNTTAHFINAILNEYFYVGEYVISITTNPTKQTCKILPTNSQKVLSLSIPQTFKEGVTNKTLSIDVIKKYEKKIAKLLCSYFTPELILKVEKCNDLTLKSKIGKIDFNYTSTKWGHCTSKNDIMIHISLLNAPLEIFEYVIYHELAHTKVKNHSSAYWKVCNSLTPHTKYARKYLKSTPPTLFMIRKPQRILL